MASLRIRSFQSVPGEYYGTPKELWGFRTPARAGKPEEIARAFLKANADHLGLHPDLKGIRRTRIVESLGAFHVIFQQYVMGWRVHRAYLTVHLDRRGRAYLVKNRAAPDGFLPVKAECVVSMTEAKRLARRALTSPRRTAHIASVEQMWFPRGRRLILSWRVKVVRHRPREDWIVYVNAERKGILDIYDNLALATGRARVFDPSPVTALGSHDVLLGRKGYERRPPAGAYRTVRLEGLTGTGFLDGRRVSTRATKNRLRRPAGDFSLQSHERGFEEVMVYYHVDRALRYLEELGYRGRRAIFREPVVANARGTREDNSWYSSTTRTLTFGAGWMDDAEDAETILHELGHAIQDAITPDFGQSSEAAAMGEGFGDYFAGSFFAERKPKRYRDAVMTWDGLLLGRARRLKPPCVRLLTSRLTYRDYWAPAGEHRNGTIWSAALWDVRRTLGRQVADTIIVESHFQLDGFTTFARGARAIIDADRNLYRGQHARLLARIFRRRGIGPLDESARP